MSSPGVSTVLRLKSGDLRSSILRSGLLPDSPNEGILNSPEGKSRSKSGFFRSTVDLVTVGTSKLCKPILGLSTFRAGFLSFLEGLT